MAWMGEDVPRDGWSGIEPMGAAIGTAACEMTTMPSAEWSGIQPLEMAVEDLVHESRKRSCTPWKASKGSAEQWPCVTVGDGVKLLEGVYANNRKRRKTECDNDEVPSIQTSLAHLTDRQRMCNDIQPAFEMKLPLPTMSHTDIFGACVRDATCLLRKDADIIDREIEDAVDWSLPIAPIASSEHNKSQLSWNRVSVTGVPLPLCSSLECHATDHPHANGPLHVYLSPEQQNEFVENGKTFTGPCLMCIRMMFHTRSLVYLQSRIPITPLNRIHPPFQNMVDCCGGYKREFVITPDTHCAMTLPIVKWVSNMSVTCDIRHDGTVVHRFDESHMLFDARHLN